jgi:hypothetical protein
MNLSSLNDSSSTQQKIEAICTLGAMYCSMSDNEKDYSAKKQELLSRYENFYNTEENIFFVEVGHNASHVFFIGIDRDGKTYKRSYECYWDIPEHLDVLYSTLIKENKVAEAYALEEMIEEDKTYPQTWEQLCSNYYGHW